MDDKERSREEVDDAFEAIIDGPDQEPIKFYSEYGPISPEEDVEDVPKYRTLQEAMDALKKERGVDG